MHQLEGVAQIWRTEFSSRHTETPPGVATAVPISGIAMASSATIVIPVGNLELVRVVRLGGWVSDLANSGHLHILNIGSSASDSLGNVLAASGASGDDTLASTDGLSIDRFEDQCFLWNDSANAQGIVTLTLQVFADVRNDDAAAAHNANCQIFATWEMWRLSRR